MYDREMSAHPRRLERVMRACRGLPPELQARIEREVRAVVLALLDSWEPPQTWAT